MNGGGEFLGNGLINKALPVEAGETLEGDGDDLDPEMGLALGPAFRMAGVTGRFVDNLEGGAGERPP